jgi:5'-nucleotidase (lipoprotein e(P4) family)
MAIRYPCRAALASCCVLSLTACASTGRERVAPASRTAAAATSVRDTHERLHSVLWMQTSGEFWAATSAAYANAERTLTQAIQEKSWSAALEQAGGYESLPGAVILDLDETVLDNSQAEGQLVLDRTDFLQDTWTAWVDQMAAGAIPGAQSFIGAAEKQGVKVFFVTNRSAAEQDRTLKNLAALGIAASDETVLCTGENGWTSDKTARRAAIANAYRVLLLVGDDMNDFVSTATLTPPQRVALAKTHAQRWGRSWILLPNPSYGSWERALYQGLTNDREILLRKREQLTGFRR